MLVVKGTRCEKHIAEQRAQQIECQRKHNAVRSDMDKFYDTAAWRRLRREHARMHPLCVECEREGRVTALDVVDHIVPRKIDPRRSLDPTNLRSLCHEHHNRIGGRSRRRGGGVKSPHSSDLRTTASVEIS